jgi:hypothetical protein
VSRIILGLALLAHLLLGWLAPAVPGKPGGLPTYPAALKVFSFGEDALASRLTMIVLLAADRKDEPLRALDYGQVERWLEASARLDPRNAMPVHAAAHIYGAVADSARRNQMERFVERHRQNLTKCKEAQARPCFR